jgi:hypothetical protein
MAHGSGNHSNFPRIKIPKKNLEDKGAISKSANDWWWQYITVGPWFNQALFLFGPGARWQDGDKNLASHVSNWFKVVI